MHVDWTGVICRIIGIPVTNVHSHRQASKSSAYGHYQKPFNAPDALGRKYFKVFIAVFSVVSGGRCSFHMVDIEI